MGNFHAFENHMKDKLGARVHMFLVKYAQVIERGQGNLVIHCKPLWDMNNEQFEEMFGVKIKEDVVNVENGI